MGDFFEWIYEFFKSDFCNNHILTLIVLALLLFVLGFIAGWAYMKYIKMVILLNNVKKFEDETKKLSDEKEQLNRDLDKANDKFFSLKKEFDEYKLSHSKTTIISGHKEYDEFEEDLKEFEDFIDK